MATENLPQLTPTPKAVPNPKPSARQRVDPAINPIQQTDGVDGLSGYCSQTRPQATNQSGKCVRFGVAHGAAVPHVHSCTKGQSRPFGPVEFTRLRTTGLC